jgi:hypothetical protein
MSIIVWSSKGFVVTTRSTIINFLTEPVVALALAALHAMEFSKKMGL